MGEPTGRENEVRAGAGALSEGTGDLRYGNAADPTFSDELPVFHASRQSTSTLDLAVLNNEPEQLIRYLVIAAREQIGFSENDSKWKVLLGHFAKANEELARANEPRARGSVAPES